MKYIIRSIKYFFYFALLTTLIICALVMTGLAEGDIDTMFRGGSSAIWKMALFFVAIAAVYPKVGFITRRISTDKNWNEMIKDPIFYVLFLMLIGGAFFGLMMISQCSAVAQRMIGLEAAVAATIVSILSLGNAAGLVLCGFISDKIGRINTITAALVLAVVGLAMVWKSGVGTPNQMLFTVGIVFVGFCFGSFMGVYPGFTAEQFGLKNNGVNYGIMFIAFGVAGVAGPMIMTKKFAATGSYSGAILIALAIAVAGLVLSFVYRAMSKAKK